MSTVGAFSAAGSASLMSVPGPANRDPASAEARFSRPEVGLTPDRDALKAVQAATPSDLGKDAPGDQQKSTDLPGSQSVKQSLLGQVEKKNFPDYDPAKAREKRSKAIADMVDRFEEALSRIDEYIQDQLPASDQSSLHSADGESSRVLDSLVGAADLLFESLVDRAGVEGKDSPAALNVLL